MRRDAYSCGLLRCPTSDPRGSLSGSLPYLHQLHWRQICSCRPVSGAENCGQARFRAHSFCSSAVFSGGEGDGICLLVSGLMTGLTHAVILAETALILAAAAGAICIWTGRKKAEEKIAFVPFLAAAQSLILAAEVVKTARV